MSKTVFIEGTKTFKSFFKKILRTMNLDFEFIDEDGFINNKFYDYIVIDCNASKKDIYLKGSCCFINMDNTYNDFIHLIPNTITYGFGCKNNITLSSIEENNKGFSYCINRCITNGNGKNVPIQEIPIKTYFSCDSELYAEMVGISISLLEDVKNKIN